jgi:hypothetical protein
MNIFMVSKSPEKSAKMLCDKHVIKMILESTQLLSTAKRMVDGTEYVDRSSGRSIRRWRLSDTTLENVLYKATHVNHPCNVWLRESITNYNWLYEHTKALCSEYTHRYGKVHKCESMLPYFLLYPPQLPSVGFTFPALAMPDEYKNSSCFVDSYRKYYIHTKLGFAKYTNREIPDFLQEHIQ